MYRVYYSYYPDVPSFKLYFKYDFALYCSEANFCSCANNPVDRLLNEAVKFFQDLAGT